VSQKPSSKKRKPVVAALAELPDCKVLAIAGSSDQFTPNRPRCHAIGPFPSAQKALLYERLLNKHGALASVRAEECKEDRGRFWVYVLPGKSAMRFRGNSQS
jgi:hypothetical protein